MDTIQKAEQTYSGYSDSERPLPSYTAIVGVFNLIFAVFLLFTRTSGRKLPERLSLWDLLLMGAATQKMSRLISKDTVTSFIRAPFVRYEGPGSVGREVSEEVRGRGMRRAVGELLTCTYCVAQWVAAGFAYAFVLAPRATRFAAGVFSLLLISDLIEMGYYSAVKGSSLVGIAYEEKLSESRKDEKEGGQQAA